MDKIKLFIATLGIGKWMPFMGTVGSIISLPFCILAVYLFSLFGFYAYGAILGVVLFVGVWSVPCAEKLLGPMKDPYGKVREHDQNQISIDETLGMIVSSFPLLFVNVFGLQFAVSLGMTFVVFRFFDVVKIWPTKVFDRMQNAWGVMLDDVVAGLYSATVLYEIFFFLGWL